MSPLLYSLGRWSAHHRKLVVVLWLGLIVLLGGGAALFGKGLDNAISIPGTESQVALNQLSATFPQVSGTSARIVLVAPEGDQIDDPAIETAVSTAVGELEAIDGVSAVVSPFDDSGGDTSSQVSDDGRAALVTVQMEGSAQTVSAETKEQIRDVADTLADDLPNGSQAVVGGELFSQNLPALTATEAIGLLVALVVLALTLGSLIAAGMPILTALVGVGATMGVLFLSTSFASISSTTPMLALMLGLAVGIDYALFLLSRHQEQLRDGVEAEESIGRATATAGSAVIFAGVTVIIALVGLAVANIPFLTTMGIAAAIGVAIAVLVSLTLIPALLGFAGARLAPGRRARRRAERRAARAVRAGGTRSPEEARVEAGEPAGATPRTPPRNRFFTGWVRLVTRWPIATIALVVVGLGALALPAANLRLALPDAGGLPESNSARVAYDLTSEYFGEGFNGPLIVTGTIVTSTDPVGLMNDIADEIRALPGVANVPLATPNETADTGIVQVIPEGGPDSEATKTLVSEIRGLHDHFEREYGVDLSVTGFTAAGIDVSDRLGAALLPFGLIVVGLSLVLLTMVFRSIWVPIKASLGYLLSIGAAFGVVSLVFESGVFAEALHVAKTGPVISFMPIILMGVLFGLAMDYEVFLVSRMREDYVHSGRARASVASGFVGSAKVVTAAAIIMFAVFAAFVPEGDVNIKPIALGLAVGVFVDAFIVRMTLVPAVMHLLGDRAWWIPRWLDRILPSFDIEGEGLQRELALAEWPRRGSTAAVSAEGLGVADEDRVVFRGVDLEAAAGSAVVVRSDRDRSAVTGLLLTVVGRMRPTEGRLKSGGLLLPERGSAVRSRSVYLDLDGAESAQPVFEALAERPALIALDGADRIAHASARDAIRAALAQAAPGRGGTPLTIVAGGLDADAVAALLPPASPRVDLDLDAARDAASSPAPALAGAPA